MYNVWNKDGEKNLQVIVVSGDKSQAEFNQTMKEVPWVAIPYDGDKSGAELKVPCTGYPTPGIINGTTGDVIDADCFGKVNQSNYEDWISKV